MHAVLVGQLDPAVRATALAQLGNQGVAVVHHAEHDDLSAYSAAAWASAVAGAAAASSAEVLLAAGTPRGSEVLAHVATRLSTPMAAQVVAVADAAAGEPLVVSRQVMGGSVHELMRLDATPAVLTVAGHAVEPTAASAPTEPEVRGVHSRAAAGRPGRPRGPRRRVRGR